jgi:hypothetical protein
MDRLQSAYRPRIKCKKVVVEPICERRKHDNGCSLEVAHRCYFITRGSHAHTVSSRKCCRLLKGSSQSRQGLKEVPLHLCHLAFDTMRLVTILVLPHRVAARTVGATRARYVRNVEGDFIRTVLNYSIQRSEYVTQVDSVKNVKQRNQNNMILHYIGDKNINKRIINGSNEICDINVVVCQLVVICSTLGTYI